VKFKRRSTSPLRKQARKGFRGYPAATLAFYGPDDTRASKVAVGIVRDEGGEVAAMERWFSDDGDIRKDQEIGDEILRFLNSQGVKTILITERIIGCPHEEGIDYPDGQVCPRCPFWAGRDRWTGERIQ
jgi:hypothetical protein